MRTRTLLFALCAAMSAAVTSPWMPAQASQPAWLSCDFSGAAHMATPMTMTDRHIRFTSVVRFDHCLSSVSSVKSGTGHTFGAFDGSCLSAAGTAVQRIVWSNHRTSVVRATFINLGAEVVSEQVVRGAFRNVSGGNVNAVAGPPSALTACAGRGVTAARFVGHIVMGD